ncbi:MAG: MFS transporter [Oscillospiraceae bacterium]|nr:MFS transporter [Oscillospiraceae bacterium]
MKKHLNDQKMSLFLFIYIWIMYAIVYWTKNCFSGAMASIVAEGIMTKSQTGLITAVFYLVYAPLQVVGGKLADRWRPDLLILIGLIGSGIANFIIYLNQNYYLMLIVWTLNSVVQSALWPSIFKIISSELAHEHRIRGVYYITFASTFGLCFAFISAALMSKWQNNFLLSSILLFIMAIIMAIVYPIAARRMVPDETGPAKALHEDFEHPEELDTRSFTMFKKCGLFILLPVVIARGLLGLGIKNMAPTLLMESYASVSPVVGNFLNIFIILSGLVGMYFVKRLYPRRINDEVKGLGLIFTILIPVVALTLLVGKLPLSPMVIILCLIIALTEGSGLFTQYYTVKFAKYGKNGEVAGYINMAAAFGIVIQSYGVAKIADMWGWIAALAVLLALVIISVVLIIIVIPKWKKFTREYHM